MRTYGYNVLIIVNIILKPIALKLKTKKYVINI